MQGYIGFACSSRHDLSHHRLQLITPVRLRYYDLTIVSSCLSILLQLENDLHRCHCAPSPTTARTEILNLADSVVRTADAGGKLSVKLFTSTRRVKQVSKSIDTLSQEIASNGAVLKQFDEGVSKFHTSTTLFAKGH